MRAQNLFTGQMNERFTIPLNGLAAGENRFFWQADKEFFEIFENTEILDAHMDVDVVVVKSGRYVGVDCSVKGKVTVECDRCLDDLDVPVDVEVRLSVKYGAMESSEEPQQGDREVVIVPDADAELDMSQIIYDYVCLSLPMQRVHEPGGCNPAAMKYYSMPEGFDVFNEEKEMNPFSVLKDMFD